MSVKPRSNARRQLVDEGFVLDTRSLGRRPGSMREVSRTIVAPEKIGLDLIAIPAGREIQAELQLQAVSEGVLITGTVTAPLEGECGRCLEQFSDTVTLQLVELFAYPDSVTEQTTEDGEVYHLADDHADLEPLIVDAVGLALPLQPVCTPDCPGLCSECGIRLAIAETGHSHEILDPRWAGLANKFATESSKTESPGTALKETQKTEEN